MNIALVSYEFDAVNPSGGIGTYMRNIARMLAKRGHKVAVFTSGSSQRQENYEGATIFQVPSGREEFRSVVMPIFATCHGGQPFDVVESAEYGSDAATISAKFPEVAR